MKDLVGQKFGLLTALKPAGIRKDRCPLWLCRCDCGNEHTVAAACLNSGHTKSCGCARKLDLVGQKFGRLTVVRRIGSRCSSVDWECLCECGKLHNVITKFLRGGYIRSCGCLQGDTARKHGDKAVWRTPEYRAYMGAKARCNPDPTKNKDHADYAGRGIKFSFTDFKQFLAEVGPRPSDLHSLDRKENDGNYEPGNVMWATWQEQANNRRNSCEALKEQNAALKARIAELEAQVGEVRNSQ